MPPVKKLKDSQELIKTSEFPIAKFPFDEFNPVQSRILDIYNQDANCVIAASTSAGKTICAELFMADEIRRRGGKAMYLAPLRALAKEKIDDWTNKNHHFADLKMSICTSDYRLTADRREELEASNIIIMTTEMLSSRCRNYKSENNEWLKSVGVLVCDESHLLTVPGRGAHLEVGLMKFTQIAPHARLVLLSATMPNVDEISDWVSYYLTGRTTYLVESKFRPCPLKIHYIPYQPGRYYEDNEISKIKEAIQIVKKFPEDKFLIFTHTKRTGKMAKVELAKIGISAEFHSADLEKESRYFIERSFKEDPSQRVIVATSTLAWGCDLPARRVIITGIHRGQDLVENYDIWQMVGRAGRPSYDPRGDAYILIPANDRNFHISRLESPQNIESKLLQNFGDEDHPRYKTLAFHLVSEIHHGHIKNKSDIHKWYNKSLARIQSDKLEESIIDSTIEILVNCGAIREEGDEYVATMLGRIASMFYYSPFDVSNLKKNLSGVFEGNYEKNDMVVSIALGNIDSHKFGIVNASEREEMGQYSSKIKLMWGDYTPCESAIKTGFAYYCLMNGYNLGAFTSLGKTLQFDFPRTIAVLNAIDQMSAKWNRKDWFYTLHARMVYGVRAELVNLVRIPNIGKVRAEKLWAAGLRDVDDVAGNFDKVKKVLNMKDGAIEKICQDAKIINLTS